MSTGTAGGRAEQARATLHREGRSDPLHTIAARALSLLTRSPLLTCTNFDRPNNLTVIYYTRGVCPFNTTMEPLEPAQDFFYW